MSYYNDYDDESVTLEEAMDYIDDYLTEKGAYGKWLDKREAEIEQVKKEIKTLRERVKRSSAGPGKKRLEDLLDKKTEKLTNLRDRVVPSSTMFHSTVGKNLDGRNLLNKQGKASATNGLLRGEVKYLKDNKYLFNQATGGPTRRNEYERDAGDRGRQTIPESLIRANAQKKAKREAQNQRTQESVNDLRLQVFEAYESGAISEDEKYTFLDYLNLDNYE